MQRQEEKRGAPKGAGTATGAASEARLRAQERKEDRAKRRRCGAEGSARAEDVGAAQAPRAGESWSRRAFTQLGDVVVRVVRVRQRRPDAGSAVDSDEMKEKRGCRRPSQRTTERGIPHNTS